MRLSRERVEMTERKPLVEWVDTSVREKVFMAYFIGVCTGMAALAIAYWLVGRAMGL